MLITKLLSRCRPVRRTDQKLLLLLQPFHNGQRHFQRASYNIFWCEREPLGKAYVGHAIALIELNPNQLLGLRSILDVMA